MTFLSTDTSTTSRFVYLGGCVLVFHLLNSVLQEAVFHIPGFNHTVLVSFFQALGVALFALLEMYINSSTAGGGARNLKTDDSISTPSSGMVPSSTVFCGFISKRASLKTYIMLSVFATVSVVLTNRASHLLNYATQVVFKSSKLFFVMLLRLVLKMSKEKSNQQLRREFLSCGFIVVGLVIFTFETSKYNKGKSTKSSTLPPPTLRPGETNPTGLATAAFHDVDTLLSADMVEGILSIIGALCCDAMLYISEELYCFSPSVQASSEEVIFFTYVIAALNNLGVLTVFGLLPDGLKFIHDTPSFLFLVAFFSAANFGGTRFLLRVVSEFDSNAAVIITSTRKLATVLLSFLIYPKPFGVLHAVGMVLVTVGIGLYEITRIYFKKAKRKMAAATASHV